MTEYHQQESSRKNIQIADDIRNWLISNLSEQLGITPEHIGVREPFTSYGLSSKEAVMLSGDLEDWLGRKVSPNLFYEYANIESLVRYLAENLDDSAAGFIIGDSQQIGLKPTPMRKPKSINQSSNTNDALPFSTLVELLRWRAHHQPDKKNYIFLVDGETEEQYYTYQQLDERARAIAARLQALGKKGERALLLYPPGIEYIAALFGCLYAGVVAIPAYPPRPNRSILRLQAIVADSQATVALTTTDLLSNLERRFAHAFDLRSLQWLATENLDSGLAENWQPYEVSSDSPAIVQYTSGSTAAPKGVMMSHENLLHNQRLMQHVFQHTEHSCAVGWLPLYHDMGLIGHVLQSLYAGFPCVLMSPVAFLQKPMRWLQAVSRFKATSSGAPNFAYDLCVRKISREQRATLDLGSWEVAYNGSEPIRHKTLEQFAAYFEPCGFRPEAFYPCYGLAEATLIVSGGLKAARPIVHNFQASALEQNKVVTDFGKNENVRTLVGCGQTIMGQKIAIVNPETSTRCASDEVGEIWVSGPSVAQGYLNRPEETEYAFRAYLADTGEGPFLRTGDLGFLKNDELFVTGRLKDLIIIRGANHYPQDIEMTVEKSHPALRQGCGAAFSVEIDDEERLVVVHEVERLHRHSNLEEIAGAIRQAVAEQQAPASSKDVARYERHSDPLGGFLKIVAGLTCSLLLIALL